MTKFFAKNSSNGEITEFDATTPFDAKDFLSSGTYQISAGSDFAVTNLVIPAVVAPQFNTIPNQSLTLDNGVLQVNLASYNVGDPIDSWSDSGLPTGVTRVNGVVSIDTALTGEVVDSIVSVTATNEGGSDVATFNFTVAQSNTTVLAQRTLTNENEPAQVAFAPHLNTPTGDYTLETAPPSGVNYDFDAVNGVLEVKPNADASFTAVVSDGSNTCECPFVIHTGLNIRADGAANTVCITGKWPRGYNKGNVTFEVERVAVGAPFTGTPTVTGLTEPRYNDAVGVGESYDYQIWVNNNGTRERISPRVTGTENASRPLATPVATNVTSVTLEFGETMYWDTPVDVYKDKAGKPFVVSSTSNTGVGGTPAARNVTYSPWGSRLVDGMMENPFNVDETQGYGTILDNTSKPTREITFDATKQIDGIGSWNAGDSKVFVKSIFKAPGTEDSPQDAIDYYNTLHVLTEVPPANVVLDGISAVSQCWYQLADAVDMDIAGLPSLPNGVHSSWATLAEAKGKLLPVAGEQGQSADQRNSLMARYGYSDIWGPQRTAACGLLLSQASAAEKEEFSARLLSSWMDHRAVAHRTGYWSVYSIGAGQHFGLALQDAFVAKIFKLEEAQNAFMIAPSNELHHQSIYDMRDVELERISKTTFWVTEGIVGQNGHVYADRGRPIPFYPEYLGDLYYSSGAPGGQKFGSMDPKNQGYVDFHYDTSSDAILRMWLLSDVIDGLDAYTLMTRGRPVGLGNQWGCTTAATFQSFYTPENFGTQDQRKFWDDYHSGGSIPYWEGSVQPIVTTSNNVTGGANQLSLNFEFQKNSTSPITNRGVLISTDTLLYHDFDGFSNTDTFSDLDPGTYQVSVYKENSVGSSGKGWPLEVTVTGSILPGGPVNIRPPQVCWQPYSDINHHYIGGVSGDVADPANGVIKAGNGLWKGTNGTRTYKWFLDGVEIIGQTNKTLQLQTSYFSEAGTPKVISFEETVTDGTTAVSLVSEAVTMPELKVLPTNVPIDTDFQGFFSVYYPDILANTIATGANKQVDISFKSTEVITTELEGDQTVQFDSDGALIGRKTDAFPTLTIPLGPVSAGESYYVEFAAPAELRNQEGRIFGSNGTGPDESNILSFVDTPQGSAIRHRRLINLPTNYAHDEIWLRVRNTTPTGGTAGDDCGITSLKLTKPALTFISDQTIYSGQAVKYYAGLNNKLGTYSIEGLGASIDQFGVITVVGQEGQNEPIKVVAKFTPDDVNESVEISEFNITHRDASIYWTPDRIQSKLLYLMDPRIGTVADVNNNYAVISLADQSNNPAIVDTIISGQPYIKTVGGVPSLNVQPGEQIKGTKTLDLSGNPALTIMAAVRGSNITMGNFAQDFSIAGANRQILLETRGAGAYFGNGSAQFEHPTTEINGITSFVYPGPTHNEAQLWRNGLSIAQSNTPGTNDISDFANEPIDIVFGDEDFSGNGKQAFILHASVIQGELTEEERQKYEGYISDVTQFSLDESHPYSDRPSFA